MRSPRINPVFSLIFLFLAIPPHLGAQRLDKRLQKKDKQDFTRPLRGGLDRNKKKEEAEQQIPFGAQFQPQPLEAAVDPDVYVIGPGDIFHIGIWSSLEVAFSPAVNPEGKLIIPTIGALDVNGKTLSEVQDLVTREAAKKYLRAEITVGLLMLREIRVHVTGQVKELGTYIALAVDRVSDIIKEAKGLTNWASETNIEVKHLDGTVDQVNLFRYHKLGDLGANPLLRGGDVIFVPTISFTAATVKIEGLLNDPGVYQLAENETLQQFLLRVDALNRRADLQYAYVERKSNPNGNPETIPVFPYLQGLGNGHDELILQNGDVIYIPKRPEEVYVVGALRNPGPYAYYPNLRAIDYVGFAGGTDRAASLSKIKVVRKKEGNRLKGPDVSVEPGDTILMPARVQFGVREITSMIGTVASVLLTMKAIGVIN